MSLVSLPKVMDSSDTAVLALFQTEGQIHISLSFHGPQVRKIYWKFMAMY
jgi:hypothetical protein